MIPRKIIGLFLVVIKITVISWAQETKENPLSLKQCIDLALKQNPLLLSYLSQYEASLARISQAKALPQPSVNFDSDLQPKLFNFKGSGESYVGFSQTVEFPGKRMLRGKIAAREADEILSDIELLKLDLIFQVKQAFFSLLLAKEKFKYAQQDLELSEDFLNKAKIKLTAGDVAEVEVLRASVETSKAANAVKIAQNEERLAAAALNYLLARGKYGPLEIQGELKSRLVPLDIEEFRQRAFSFRPEIKRINFALEKEGLKKRQAYLSYLPDFDLGISRHRIAGEQKTWDFTISFPIPLFFWQPKKGVIAETEATIESLKRERDHLKDAINLEVESVTTNALSASNQIKLFEEKILAQAEEVYNIFLLKFQQGEIGGIELIEARRSLNEARREYADALFNYSVTIAALEKSVGLPLEGGYDE